MTGRVKRQSGSEATKHPVFPEQGNGRRLGKIEFGVRNSVPSAKEIQEAIRDGFPNGTTYKLLVPTSVCINQ